MAEQAELFAIDDRGVQITARTATIVLFMEGFVSVSVQMLALRQIVPFVGYSIAVTSIVITIFLAALAYGYRSGAESRRITNDTWPEICWRSRCWWV